jgi:site-specific DNA recombinase
MDWVCRARRNSKKRNSKKCAPGGAECGVYKGEYTFGRRSAHHAGRDVVTCAVAAIVSPETSEAARAQLTKNQLVNVGNATRDYLLRGLITCGQCGYHYFTESGTHPRYICVNRRHAVLLWGSRTLADERRCRDSLSLRAAKLEQDIWRRLEVYLRHPDEALDELAARTRGQADAASTVRAQIAAKQQEQARKQEERDTIFTLHRTGIMTETDLRHQLDAITSEQVQLAKDTAKLTEQLGEADAISAKLDAASALLQEQRSRLDAGPLTFATCRAIVETLVRRIVVKTELDEETFRPRAGIYPETCFDREDADLTTGELVGILDSTAGPFVLGQAG